MNSNEIMTNEEVIETTEEIVKVGSGKGFKVAAGIGLTVLAGIFVYKYVVKPVMAKIKIQKEQQKIYEESLNVSEDDGAESEEAE